MADFSHTIHSIDWNDVVTLFSRGKTYKEVAMQYAVNVNTFISWCTIKNIKKRDVQQQFLPAQVQSAIAEVLAI